MRGKETREAVWKLQRQKQGVARLAHCSWAANKEATGRQTQGSLFILVERGQNQTVGWGESRS